MGPGVGGAVVMGLLGYIFYRFWIATGLGVVAALWMGLGIWVMMGPGAQWSWPAVGQQAGESVGRWVWEVLVAGWGTMPAGLVRVLPFACGATLVCAAAAGMFWPKVGQVMFYSLAGTSLMVGAALAEMKWNWPGGLAKVPEKRWVQVAVLGGVVMVGVVFQWLLVKGGGGGAKKKEGKKKGEGQKKGDKSELVDES